MITVICTANVCRSPMAEKLLQRAMAAAGDPLAGIPILSAGVMAHNGQAASANSIEALRLMGLDLRQHQSQPLTQELLDRSFAVFCMTHSHKAIIQTNFYPIPQHLLLMRELLPGHADSDIPDPIGQNLAAYKACRDSIVEAIPYIIDYLRKEYPPS